MDIITIVDVLRKVVCRSFLRKAIAVHAGLAGLFTAPIASGQAKAKEVCRTTTAIIVVVVRRRCLQVDHRGFRFGRFAVLTAPIERKRKIIIDFQST